MGRKKGQTLEIIREINKARILAVKSVVTEDDVESGFKNLIPKLLKMDCFAGISRHGLLNFLHRNKSKLGLKKNSEAKAKGTGEGKSDSRVELGKSLGIVLSIYSQTLSYDDSVAFSKFVESELKPFIIELYLKAEEVKALNAKIQELESNLSDLQSHQCPNPDQDLEYTIRELREEKAELIRQRDTANQRNGILSSDIERLRRRLGGPESAMAVHAASVRLGAESSL